MKLSLLLSSLSLLSELHRGGWTGMLTVSCDSVVSSWTDVNVSPISVIPEQTVLSVSFISTFLLRFCLSLNVSNGLPTYVYVAEKWLRIIYKLCLVQYFVWLNTVESIVIAIQCYNYIVNDKSYAGAGKLLRAIFTYFLQIAKVFLLPLTLFVEAIFQSMFFCFMVKYSLLGTSPWELVANSMFLCYSIITMVHYITKKYVHGGLYFPTYSRVAPDYKIGCGYRHMHWLVDQYLWPSVH